MTLKWDAGGSKSPISLISWRPIERCHLKMAVQDRHLGLLVPPDSSGDYAEILVLPDESGGYARENPIGLELNV